MAPITSSEARQGASILDSVIEERISLQLTPEVVAKLAAKGISEPAARSHLRQRAAEALLAEYAR